MKQLTIKKNWEKILNKGNGYYQKIKEKHQIEQKLLSN